jgi:hypothetical protein
MGRICGVLIDPPDIVYPFTMESQRSEVDGGFLCAEQGAEKLFVPAQRHVCPAENIAAQIR